jgi:hypothetical protein
MFLVTFKIVDGGAEHFLYKVVFASTESKATAKVLDYAKDFFGNYMVRDEDNAHMFWDEDGTRTIELEVVEKTTVDDLVKGLLIE